ncbi:hypothetical protein BJY04DRAFT_215371 [Aspergillus karnatakaensis]|uniref:uncharacterized protein n=1 Tax=Aspergillus karnatakaensis TaxID=1810916 RepID=UPI003CCD078C
MPMRWTPEQDQQLLLKILETNNNLSVDVKKISEAWTPSPGQQKPTPRAITERLVKIRQMAKSSASASGTDGHFSIGKGAKSPAAATPRKNKGFSISTSESSKRKRVAMKTTRVKEEDTNEPTELEESGREVVETPTKKMKGLGLSEASVTPSRQYSEEVEVRAGSTLNIKQEQVENDDVFDVGVGAAEPKKRQTRVRRATALLGMVEYGNALGDDDEEESEGDHGADYAESSASDYEEYA